MQYLVIEGLKPWDGRYPFQIDDDAFTYEEWRWIKQHSGYMPLTIADGFRGGDPDLYACFAVIALHRAGRIQADQVDEVMGRIGQIPFGQTIWLDGDPVEDEDTDAGPPAPRQNGNTSSSGDDSLTSSETSTGTPSGSGTPASASSEWPRRTSGA